MNYSSGNFAAIGKRLIRGTSDVSANGSDAVRFVQSKSGFTVPQLVNSSTVSSLHSLYDPIQEAEKLCKATQCERGMFVFFGLGAAYHIQYLLESNIITNAIIVEHNCSIVEATFKEIDLSSTLKDQRILLLLDVEPEKIALMLKETFNPHIDRRCRIFELSGRLHGSDIDYFISCKAGLEAALREILGDIAAQAAFSLPWLRNMLHNLKHRYTPRPDFILPAKQVLIAAAGPGLEEGIQEIREKAETSWILAVDTSLGCLLSHGITPDAVLSIDCQYISTNHFMHELPASTTVFLDIATHPAIGASCKNVYYVGSMHPLVTLLCKDMDPFPQFDFSGGNVAYAACELADYLGAQTIELFGADYAYTRGKTYANGTYLHTLFLSRDSRTKSLDTFFADLLFRNKSLRHEIEEDGIITYRTELLDNYRKALRRRVSSYSAKIIFKDSKHYLYERDSHGEIRKTNCIHQKPAKATVFLQRYKTNLVDLEDSFIRLLDGGKSESADSLGIFQSLFPVFAYLQGRHPNITSTRLVKEALLLTIQEIEK